jgi:hypothetical protein
MLDIPRGFRRKLCGCQNSLVYYQGKRPRSSSRSYYFPKVLVQHSTMILLTLALFRELLIPSTAKLDRLDHALLWVIKISLVVLFLALPQAVLSEEDGIDGDFFFACSGGKLDQLKSYLNDHPGWVNSRTDNGESCLHLAGIHGYSDVTEYLLVKGADPNIRSTYEHGLRMHPLSWNIYGGHVANVDLLLKHGADVNLDFDSMGESKTPVTALDVVIQLTQNEEGDSRFVQLEKILRDYGGKTIEELKSQPTTESLPDEL